MPPFKLENAIGYAVNRAALRLKGALHRAFRESGYDITPEHWAVLNCLWDDEGMSQTQIAERIVKDKTNLTRMLDVMERNGLVSRKPHEGDRRAYRIFLTDRARAIKPDLIGVAEAVGARAVSGLSPEEQQTVLRLMNTIADNLGAP